MWGAKRQMMRARKLYKRTEKGSYWRETKESRCQWMRGGPGDGVEAGGRQRATAGICRPEPSIDICLPTPRSGRLESEICQAASTLPTTTYFHAPLHHPWPALLLGVWPFFSREVLLVLPSSIYAANESPAKVRRWGTANDSRALLTVRPLSG